MFQNNFIGVDASGTVPLGNGGDGINVFATSTFNRILGNLISGNSGSGISFFGNGSSDALIQGNPIGVDKDGIGPIGNGGKGIDVEGPPRTRIIGNVISANSGGRLLGTFGLTNLGDIPVPGDYDGVGHTELATFRPSTGQWFVLGPNGVRLLGNSGVAVPADLPAGAPIGALMSQGVLKGPRAFRTSSGSGPRAASVAEPSPTVIVDFRRDTPSSFSKPIEKHGSSTNFDAIVRIRPRVHDSIRGESARFPFATK